MFHVWKEVLCKGHQCDRFGRWFRVGSREVRDGHRNAVKMLSRGVPLPAIWEHQSDIEAGTAPATPEGIAEWKRRYAKYTFAHIGASRINGRGNLELRHDVPDPEDVKQLAKVKFCSPKVYPSYSDSRGGEYRGTTVAHVAATPTPVQFWQQPYQLSKAGALYLSYTPDEGNTVAKDDDDGKGKKKGDGDDEGGAGGEFKKLVDALRETGMNIPDEVKDICGLIIAVKASGGSSDSGGGDDDLDLDTSAGGAGSGDTTAAAGGPPMVMSMTHPDVAVRRQVAGWIGDERRDMKKRIECLFQTGRIDRPTARQLFRQSKATEMSFTADAEPVCPTLKKLAELEKKPAFSAWKPDGNGGGRDANATRTIERPHMAGTEEPDKGVLAKQEELAKRLSVGGK